MKKFLFLVVGYFIFHSVVAQEDNVKAKDTIYDIKDVDIKPDFKGGTAGFYKYIAVNFRTPEQEGLNGKIIATFIIEKDGHIDDIQILQDVGYGSGAEVVKVLSKSPKWIPALKNDIPVRTRFQLPITIKTAERIVRNPR